MNKKCIKVVTSSDVSVTLSVCIPTIISAAGEREGEPELCLVLDDTSADLTEEKFLATSFTLDQLDKFIGQLHTMRHQISKLCRN